MLSKKHQLILTAISVSVLFALAVTAFAVVGGKKPDVTSGGFSSPYADRIAVSFENTEFTLKKSTDAAETFTLTSIITLKKTQADFYALINSFTVSDISYDNIVFTALTDEAENKTLDSLLLTASDGEPDIMKWQVDITLSIRGKGTYHPVIKLDYISGVTEETAVHRFAEIPLTVTVK